MYIYLPCIFTYLISVYQCLQEECQGDEARLCSVLLVNRTRGNGQEMMHTGEIPPEYEKSFFTGNRLPREGAESPSLEISKICLD